VRVVSRSASATDRRILDELASRGIRVSAYQLERWRTRGLVPRNVRRGRGRGRGTSSAVAADLVPSLETVALANTQRWDIELQILRMMHDLAESPEREYQLDRLAERPIRKALEFAVVRERPSPMDEDAAYAVANSFAISDGFLTWPEKRGQYTEAEIEKMRAAYEHVLAADRIGVAAVGWGMLVDSVIKLQWADPEAADDLVDYLDLVLNRRLEHITLAREAPYDKLLMVAKVVVRVSSFTGTFPDRLVDSSFPWLPSLHHDYRWWPTLLMAMLMDRDFFGAATDFLARHPEDVRKEWHRKWLVATVAEMRARHPEGIHTLLRRPMPVGIEEFVDMSTGKWR
jgi:hypothetical protein